MQLGWRLLRPHELDHELLWLMISVAAVVCSAVWLYAGLPWPVCWFHELTGRPCATCGATRAAIAFLHGDFSGSWQWNPLAFALYCAIALFDSYAVFVLVTRGPRVRVSFGAAEKKMFQAFAVAVLALNWVYLLAHTTRFAG
jgi:Protein of unknown function (DUF2752)